MGEDTHFTVPLHQFQKRWFVGHTLDASLPVFGLYGSQRYPASFVRPLAVRHMEVAPAGE